MARGVVTLTLRLLGLRDITMQKINGLIEVVLREERSRVRDEQCAEHVEIKKLLSDQPEKASQLTKLMNRFRRSHQVLGICLENLLLKISAAETSSSQS